MRLFDLLFVFLKTEGIKAISADSLKTDGVAVILSSIFQDTQCRPKGSYLPFVYIVELIQCSLKEASPINRPQDVLKSETPNYEASIANSHTVW